MGKSFVLKDLSGYPGGYAMQSASEICIRANLDGDLHAALLFEDGTKTCIQLNREERETKLCCQGKQLNGCCIFRGAEPLLVSGETAKELWQSSRVGKEKPAAEERSFFKPHEAEAQGLAEAESVATYETCSRCIAEREVRALPQRRWPPPVCLRDAQYIKGRWQEKEE